MRWVPRRRRRTKGTETEAEPPVGRAEGANGTQVGFLHADDKGAGPPDDAPAGAAVDTFGGSLESFPLESVVRLIAGSDKTGVVKIENTRLTGRVFMADGGVVHATTRTLEGRGPAGRSSGDRRSRQLSDDPTLQGGDSSEEQIVEVFVRLLRDRQGTFSFVPGVTSSAAGEDATSFDVGAILEQAERHLEQWRRIEALVPGPTARYLVAPELPVEKFEVTLDARRWMFLSAIGGGSSVNDVAERLGVFEFPAAMQVAEMVREGLLVSEADLAPAPSVTVTTSFTPASKRADAGPTASSPTADTSG